MKKKHAASQSEIGEHYKVSRQTVGSWALKSDFPAKTAEGYDLAQIDKWLKKHQLGPYRGERATRLNGKGHSLTEAKISQLNKRSIREDIAIELEMIELEAAKGNILLADEVARLHQQLAATFMTVREQLADAFERELPEACPTEESWEEIRKRAVLAAMRISRDLAGVIEGFLVNA